MFNHFLSNQSGSVNFCNYGEQIVLKFSEFDLLDMGWFRLINRNDMCYYHFGARPPNWKLSGQKTMSPKAIHLQYEY